MGARVVSTFRPHKPRRPNRSQRVPFCRQINQPPLREAPPIREVDASGSVVFEDGSSFDAGKDWVRRTTKNCGLKVLTPTSL